MKPPAENARPRRETMEVDLSWLERESVPPATAARSEPKKRSVKPPPLQVSARRETMEVRLEWLESETAESPRRRARVSEAPPPVATRRKLPPPLPREEPDDP